MLQVRRTPVVRIECNGPVRAVVRVDGTLEREQRQRGRRLHLPHGLRAPLA
jgi:hypothetical protein